MSSYLWPLAFTAAKNVLVHIANAVAKTEPCGLEDWGIGELLDWGAGELGNWGT